MDAVADGKAALLITTRSGAALHAIWMGKLNIPPARSRIAA
jgi:hypothetical protein